MSKARRKTALIFTALAALFGAWLLWLEAQPPGRGEVSSILSGAFFMLLLWLFGISALIALFTAVWPNKVLRSLCLAIVIFAVVFGSLWVGTDGFRALR